MSITPDLVFEVEATEGQNSFNAHVEITIVDN